MKPAQVAPTKLNNRREAAAEVPNLPVQLAPKKKRKRRQKKERKPKSRKNLLKKAPSNFLFPLSVIKKADGFTAGFFYVHCLIKNRKECIFIE